MADEIELKLEMRRADLARVPALSWLKSLSARTPKSEILTSVYYDTRDSLLRKHGVTLRVRRRGKRRVQTIKTLAGSSAGAFGRAEWESEIDRDAPNLDLAQGTALEPLAGKKLRHSLKPVFETVIRRTTIPLCERGSEIELALDEGVVRTRTASERVSEVELELKAGDPAALFGLAQRLAETVDAAYCPLSKAERGYALGDGDLGKPVWAEPIVLANDASSADAFQAIGLSCLRHFASNRTAVCDGDGEGVHQMRVGLRRLRAALSLFKEMIAGPETNLLKNQLKWLTKELGPARDIDVFITKTVAPLKEEEPDRNELPVLEHDLKERRGGGFARARAAVDSERFRKLALGVALWLAGGDWAVSKDALIAARRNRPAAEFAAEEMQRRCRKIAKRAKKLRELDPQHRHKLRIAAKKLRYATEFFASIYPGGKADARRRVLRKSLKRLQSALGKLNDIQTHEKLTGKIVRAERKPAKLHRKQVFAAGYVAGRESKAVETCITAARKAGKPIAKVPAFWS